MHSFFFFTVALIFLSEGSFAKRKPVTVGTGETTTVPERKPEESADEPIKNDGSIEDLMIIRRQQQRAAKKMEKLVSGDDPAPKPNNDESFSGFDPLANAVKSNDDVASLPQVTQCSQSMPESLLIPYYCRLLSSDFMSRSSDFGVTRRTLLLVLEALLIIVFLLFKGRWLIQMDTIRWGQVYIRELGSLFVFNYLALVVLPVFCVGGSPWDVTRQLFLY